MDFHFVRDAKSKYAIQPIRTNWSAKAISRQPVRRKPHWPPPAKPCLPGRVCPRRSAAKSSNARPILLRAEQDDVARLLTREEGKTVAEAKGEIYRAYNVLNYTAGQSRRMGGITIPSELPKNFAYTLRQPLGSFH